MSNASKQENRPKPNVEKQDFVIFAFRLKRDERDLIHQAAGPAGATQFVRAAALAASNDDRTTFEELAAQARTNLK